MALKTDGTAVAWGDPTYGSLAYTWASATPVYITGFGYITLTDIDDTCVIETCDRPAAVTATEYGTITETDLTVANFGVTLACASGYASGGTPTAACSSAGDYTVADPCTGVSSTALFV